MVLNSANTVSAKSKTTHLVGLPFESRHDYGWLETLAEHIPQPGSHETFRKKQRGCPAGPEDASRFGYKDGPQQ